MTFVKIIIITVLCAYGILILFFSLNQASFIYFPSGNIEATPENIGMEYEEIFLKASDGTSISAWFIPSEKRRGALLFCHGNAGNISHRLESIRTFNFLGFDLLIFDYRGYGMSEGKPSEEGTYLDAQAAYDFLIDKKKFNGNDIVLFGRSLGGAIAAKTALENQDSKALIIESSFTSIPDLGSEIYPFLPVKLLSSYKYSTLEYIREVRMPVLVVHSKDDEIIPFKHGRRIYEAAGGNKAFLEIRGSHNEGFLHSERKYTRGLSDFIASLEN